MSEQCLPGAQLALVHKVYNEHTKWVKTQSSQLLGKFILRGTRLSDYERVADSTHLLQQAPMSLPLVDLPPSYRLQYDLTDKCIVVP